MDYDTLIIINTFLPQSTFVFGRLSLLLRIDSVNLSYQFLFM